MAITDENFTAEEFKTVLSKKPELLKEVKGVLSNEFKHVVQDETEHTAWKKKYEDEIIAPRVSKLAQDIEKDIFELTGIPKLEKDEDGQPERYYKYLKRATGLKLKELTEKDEELARLKANHSPSAADKARIKELEEGITKEKTDSKTLKETYEKQIRNLTAGNKIDVGIGEIRATYKKDIDPDLIQTKENVVRAKLLDMAQVAEDGTVTFIGPDGKVMSDPVTLLPRTEKSLLTEYLKPLIDTGRQQSGGGSGPGTQEKGGSGPNGLPAVDTLPEGVKSKRELRAHLLKLGHTDGSPAFINIMTKLGQEHKLPL